MDTETAAPATRTSLSREHSRIPSRIQKVLEDANLKLASVASNTPVRVAERLSRLSSAVKGAACRFLNAG
jgi:hypothetical protein